MYKHHTRKTKKGVLYIYTEKMCREICLDVALTLKNARINRSNNDVIYNLFLEYD